MEFELASLVFPGQLGIEANGFVFVEARHKHVRIQAGFEVYLYNRAMAL